MGYRKTTQEIQGIVNEILKEYSSASPITEQLKLCHATAYERRKGKSKDIALAAVEHYFYARYEVAKGGKAEYKAMSLKVVGYEAIKVNPGWRWGLEKLNEVLGDPDPSTSPASAHSVEWGLLGTNHGLEDWKAMHPTASSLVT